MPNALTYTSTLFSRTGGCATAMGVLAFSAGVATLEVTALPVLDRTPIITRADSGILPALTFALAGLALLLLQPHVVRVTFRLWGRCCAALAMMLGIAGMTAQFTFGADGLPAGVDALPAGMTCTGAACAFLIGCALLLYSRSGRTGILSPLLVVPVMLISIATLNQYLYGVASPRALESLDEALVFLLLSGGILSLHCHREPLATFLSASTGGFMSRRLLGSLFLLIIAVGWIRVSLQHDGVVDTELGTALVATFVIAMTTLVTWLVARSIDRAETSRRTAEEQLRELNALLEKRVAERTVQLEAVNQELREGLSAAKAARAALRANEESYRFLFESNPMPLCVLDHETLRYIAVNQAMSEQYGYTREEFLAMTAGQLRPPEDVSRLREHFAQTHPGYNSARQWRHLRKDGTPIDVEVFEHVVSIGGRMSSLAMPFDITHRLQAEAALQDHAVRLQRLSQQLLHVQEHERARIARELHDEIGQTLTAAKLGMQSVRSAVNDTAAAGRLEDSIRMAAQVLEQVRNLSLDLRPPLLDEVGLVAALRTHVHSLGRRTGLDMEFEADALPRRPGKEVSIACFRIAQEAVTNAMRHASAKRIAVWLRLHDGNLVLEVSDDGIGFDLDASRRTALTGKSIGLLSMSERAALAGGRCDIVSAARQGTMVRAHFPAWSDSSFISGEAV